MPAYATSVKLSQRNSSQAKSKRTLPATAGTTETKPSQCSTKRHTRDQALTVLSTLPRSGHCDAYFTDCSVAKPAKNQPGRPTAAGAVVAWNIERTTYDEHLTVFDIDRRLTTIEAEAAACQKALERIANRPVKRPSYIFTDSYELLWALANGRIRSDLQYNCYKAIRELGTVINYIPGHQGLPGNTYAHDASNLRATTQLKQTRRHSHAQPTKSTHAEVQRAVKHAITPPIPKKESQLQHFLDNRKESATYTRLRTEATFLQDFAHRKGHSASPDCLTCQQPDSIKHFLYECPTHSETRAKFDMATWAGKVYYILETGKKF